MLAQREPDSTTRASTRSRSQRGLLWLGLLIVVAACSDARSQGEAKRGSASAARSWNELALQAITDMPDAPFPTRASRDLYHLSAAMYDAWAAFAPGARRHQPSIPLPEDLAIPSEPAARKAMQRTALSFAAYAIVKNRFPTAKPEGLLAELGVDPGAGSLARRVGEAIGKGYLARFATDGSQRGKDGPDPYRAAYPERQVPNLQIADSGTSGLTQAQAERWQPIRFPEGGARAQGRTEAAEQNAPSTQRYIGYFWGSVTACALPQAARTETTDPGGQLLHVYDFNKLTNLSTPKPANEPPKYSTAAGPGSYIAEAAEVVRHSSLLDDQSSETINLSPSARGSNNALGENDGPGHRINPFTGNRYPDVSARLADYGRAVAEVWADGPNSNLPPGHWNEIANKASDLLFGSQNSAIADRMLADQRERALGGHHMDDRLAWDTVLYMGLNCALHDAAVATWGLKAKTAYVRPISMIRLLAEQDAWGNVLSDGAHRDHIRFDRQRGAWEVRAWHKEETLALGEVAWITADRWRPYQEDSFVTPAFAGYTSGHSGFSRAAAVFLDAYTGSRFFPGGLLEEQVDRLRFDPAAPNFKPVTLQWATYYDAADEAGRSRLYGGIHIPADDFNGRKLGAAVGKQVVNTLGPMLAGRDAAAQKRPVEATKH